MPSMSRPSNRRPGKPSAPNRRSMTHCAGLESAEQVLVVWTEDQFFDGTNQPFSCLHALIDGMQGPDRNQRLVRVIGPNSSDKLSAVGHELGRGRFAMNMALPPRFFSPMATADALFFPKERQSLLVERTIATDLDLARAMVAELRNRGVDLPRPQTSKNEQETAMRARRDRVLLLSEWDTFYGRALPLSFGVSLLTADPADVSTPDDLREQQQATLNMLREDPDAWQKHLPEIVRVSYLRGLDGRTHRTTPLNEVNVKTPNHGLEDGVGPARLDYVRRLAIELKARQGKGPVRAIGILGSDVYDKLLLIRALREVFPESVFFTTDLDARLWQASEIRWTRNLVVASSFGLRVVHGPLPTGAEYDSAALDRIHERQLQLPPFRDNYQSSVYYAALRALGLERWRDAGDGRSVEHPQLFELGHSGPIRLAESDTRDDDCLNEEDGFFQRTACGIRQVGVELVNRFRGTSFSYGDRFGGSMRFGIVALFLLAFVLWYVRRRSIETYERMSRLELLALWGGIAGIYIFVLMVSADGVTGEPFNLTEGTSIWPTEVLRLVVFFLSLFLLGRTHRLLRHNATELAETFQLGRGHHEMSFRSLMRSLRWTTVGRDDDGHIATLWREFLVDGSRLRRSFRAFSLTGIYFAILAFFIFSGGFAASVPARDGFVLLVDRLCLFASLVAMIYLLMTIVDAVILDERFIKLVTATKFSWPRESYEKWGMDQANARPEYEAPLAEWLAIRLIGRRTEVLGGLVIGPFFVLALFVVSRATLFDRWSLPPQILLAMSINAAAAVFAAVVMWRSAETARSEAADRLNAMRLKALTSNDNELAGYIEQLTREVATMRQGAFAPVWRQPSVRALVAPLGGLITTLILERLAS